MFIREGLLFYSIKKGREKSQSKLRFDFEGSEIPGIKSFYKKTGAVEEYYYRMRINKLPFPLRVLTSVIKGK